MKTKLLPVLALLLFSPSAFAIVGGPWDHLFSERFSKDNTDGTYEASVTLKNGSGFLRFGTTREREKLSDAQTEGDTFNFVDNGNTGSISQLSTVNSLASSSNSVVFYEGEAYYGNTFGYVDGGGGVSGVLSGQAARVDQIESKLADQTAATSSSFVSVQGMNSSMGMHFTGKIFDNKPSVRFRATGTATFFIDPPASIELVGIEKLLASGLFEEVLNINQATLDQVLGAELDVQSKVGALNIATQKQAIDLNIAGAESAIAGTIRGAEAVGRANINWLNAYSASGVGAFDPAGTALLAGIITPPSINPFQVSIPTFQPSLVSDFLLVEVESLMDSVGTLTELRVDGSQQQSVERDVKVFGRRISLQVVRPEDPTAAGNNNGG